MLLQCFQKLGDSYADRDIWTATSSLKAASLMNKLEIRRPGKIVAIKGKPGGNKDLCNSPQIRQW